MKEDISGKVYGWLTVEKKKDRLLHEKIVWECLCKCGNRVLRTPRQLEMTKTPSCGCYMKSKEFGELIGNMHRLAEDVGATTVLYIRYRKGATRRNLSFTITKDEFSNLINKPCFYCGSLPNQVSHGCRGYGKVIYQGIDRIDSSRGYEIDNVVPCCKNCNYAKNSMSQKDFIDLVKRQYNTLVSKGLL